MANVSVYNMEGSEVDKIELNDSIFAVNVNEHLMHMAVTLQLANKRQGTQKAKTRSEVRGGGKKPWRQKGTGHARQGSIRAPQWKGGGVVFAPTPRSYSFKMNKKEKAFALKSALTSRVNEEKFLVMDSLKFDEIKTKKMVNVLDALKVKKALVILDGEDNANVVLSARNIQGIKTVASNAINVYDILKYETVIITKTAVSKIITEKSMNAMQEKKYTFAVHVDATKSQIKEAVEKLFEDTKVESVNTMNLEGKTRRRGRTSGKTAKSKKAIVKLTKDSKDIELFEGL